MRNGELGDRAGEIKAAAAESRRDAQRRLTDGEVVQVCREVLQASAFRKSRAGNNFLFPDASVKSKLIKLQYPKLRNG